MSWNIGTQQAKRDAGDVPNACRNIARLLVRLAWLTMTPLGADVEPEVYCRRAIAPGVGAKALAGTVPPGPSRTSHSTLRHDGRASRRPRRSAICSDVVSTKRGWQFSTIASVESRA